MIRLTNNSLKNLIRETVIHGKDFDCCLIESIFAESASFESLVSRPIRSGKALIRHKSSDGYDNVIVISKSKDGNELNAVAAAIGKSTGDGWWRLEYLYSNEPSSTPLALLGALVFYKKVLADLDVSKTAETLIKSYFDKSKDDPELIRLNADEQRIQMGRDAGTEKAHLRAGYLTPPGMESIIYKAMIAGDDYVSEIAESRGISEEKLKEDLAEQAVSGFETAYASEEKTGMEVIPQQTATELMNSISKFDFKRATRILKDAYSSKSSSRKSWVIGWLKPKQDIIVNLVKKALEKPDVYDELTAFDNILLQIVKREAGIPDFSVIGLAQET